MFKKGTWSKFDVLFWNLRAKSKKTLKIGIKIQKDYNFSQIISVYIHIYICVCVCGCVCVRVCVSVCVNVSVCG